MALPIRRFVVALFLACCVGFFPMILEKLSSGFGLSVRPLTSMGDILSFPGYLVALVFAGGRFHDLSYTVLLFGNIVIYCILTYLALTAFSKLRAKHSAGLPLQAVPPDDRKAPGGPRPSGEAGTAP
jgi:hypothetical protein